MRGVTPTSITLAQQIWMPMEPGKTHRTTVRSGCRMNRMAGLHTAMATGCGSLTTVGLGLALSLGDGPRITMGAGCGTAAPGRGGRDRCMADSIVRSGRRRMFRSSDSEVVGDWVLALDGADGAASDGCQSGPVTASSRGGADMAAGSAWWALIDLALSTASVGSRLCMRAPDFRTWPTSTTRTSEARSRRWLRVSLERVEPPRWQLLTRS